jgi:hypothetical protein
MLRRLAALCLIMFAPLIAACSTQRPDPAGHQAYGAFALEPYFIGQVKAWGLFEPRFGGSVRQFTVEIAGRREGDELVLDEDFRFSDGETDRRVWRIRAGADGRYQGRADDVLGTAEGRAMGNSLQWVYDIRLKTESGGIDVSFDDWLYRFDDEMVLNRATVRKFGIPVGSVTLAFRKIR